MNLFTRNLSKAVAPALKRAATTAATSAKQEGFQLVEVLYAAPPLLAIFGYGGIVCFHEAGALRRIRRSFNEIPH